MQTIKLGSSGADVTVWQNDLNNAGFPVTVSGTFDDATDAATKAWQSSKNLTADGIVGPASWGAMTGVAAAGKTDSRAAEGRAALLEAWPKVTGETPSLAELQIAGAQGNLESGYGHSTYKLLNHADGSVLNSSGTIWNWGAVQGGTDDGTGFLATDTGPGHVTADNPKGYYDHHYRIYPNSAAGAEDMVKEMTVRRPTSWALMKTGDIDAWAKQMWAGKLPDGTLNKDPQSGVLGYFEQKPDQRALGIEKRIADIAFTLNEPIAAKRGGPMPAGGLSTPGGDGGDGGGLVWTSDSPVGQVGLVALLGGLGLAGWRLYSGHWPWPGKFPF